MSCQLIGVRHSTTKKQFHALGPATEPVEIEHFTHKHDFLLVGEKMEIEKVEEKGMEEENRVEKGVGKRMMWKNWIGSGRG